MDKVKVAAEDKNAEGGLFAIKALADTKEPAAEAYVVAMLPIVMDKYADKVGQDHFRDSLLFAFPYSSAFLQFFTIQCCFVIVCCVAAVKGSCYSGC